MRFIPIPHTDLAPSALALGAADFGGSVDLPTAFQMLDAYLDAGGNLIDTAQVYNNWIPGETSRSEKLIGAWLGQRGGRGRVIISTKGAHPDLASMHIPRMSPGEIVSDIEGSLRRLRVETIDLYYLHRDDPARPVKEIIDTLAAQVRAGKIRYFGCSNWKAERIQAAQEFAAKHGLPGFSAVQNLWNLAVVNWSRMPDQTLAGVDEALYQYQLRSQLAAIPYSSQANGLFQKLDGGGADALPQALANNYLNAATLRRYASLQKLRTQIGLTTTQIVLGYLTSQPFPTIPVVGPKNLAQLQDSLAAADICLTPEQLASLIQ